MDLKQEQIDAFNAEYEMAMQKMKGIVILDNYRPNKIGFFEKLRAKKSIRHFENALQIVPEHFASLFFLGKIYQRLEKYEISFSYFEKALEFEKENHSLPQEASLVAMHLNKIDKALEYSKEALKRKPDSFAIMGNHAMNLLIAGKDQEAINTIETALQLRPKDSVNKNIKEKILNVINGKSKRPTFKELI